MTNAGRNSANRATIQDAIDRWTAALRNKSADAVVAEQTPDFVQFSLAPPLITDTRQTIGLEGWFATWKGPLGYALQDVVIEASGDLAVCRCLAHMTGTKTDGIQVDLWFRLTLALRKSQEGWKVMHEHDSVPFYMDGSFRACTDLKP